MMRPLLRALRRHTALKGRLKIARYVAGAYATRHAVTRLHGWCNLCGRRTTFYDLRDASEGVLCAGCGSAGRNRALVSVLLRLYAPGAASLREACTRLPAAGYLAAAHGAVYEALRDTRFTFSEYYGDRPLGEVVDGVLNQDLTRLTFPDGSFDLLVSEAVVEHVNDPLASFREAFRVLRPGGRYVLVVPFEAGNGRCVTRVAPDGTHLLPPHYHRDPLRKRGEPGALVFTDFGRADFAERMLHPAGLTGGIHRVHEPDHGILQQDVVVAERPA